MVFVSIVSLAFFAVFAIAQSSINIRAVISPCIISCVTPAAAKNGCAFSDASCVCTSAQFQADARDCLTANCTSSDVQAALGLQAQQCGAIGVSATGTFTTGSAAVTGSATTAASNSFTLSGFTGTPNANNTTSTSAPSSPSQTSAAMNLGNSMGFAGAVLLGFLVL